VVETDSVNYEVPPFEVVTSSYVIYPPNVVVEVSSVMVSDPPYEVVSSIMVTVPPF
jgi:hypothetical protein